jgi:hypothetical protein
MKGNGLPRTWLFGCAQQDHMLQEHMQGLLLSFGHAIALTLLLLPRLRPGWHLSAYVQRHCCTHVQVCETHCAKQLLRQLCTPHDGCCCCCHGCGQGGTSLLMSSGVAAPMSRCVKRTAPSSCSGSSALLTMAAAAAATAAAKVAPLC